MNNGEIIGRGSCRYAMRTCIYCYRPFLGVKNILFFHIIPGCSCQENSFSEVSQHVHEHMCCRSCRPNVSTCENC